MTTLQRFHAAVKQRQQLIDRGRKAGLLSAAEASRAIGALEQLGNIAKSTDLLSQLHDTTEWLKGRNAAIGGLVVNVDNAKPRVLPAPATESAPVTKAAPKPPSPAIRDLADRVRAGLAAKGLHL